MAAVTGDTRSAVLAELDSYNGRQYGRCKECMGTLGFCGDRSLLESDSSTALASCWVPPPASPRLSSSCWAALITRQPASIFILSCQTTLNLSLSVSVSNILYILVQPTTLPQVYRNNSFPLWSRHEQIVDINSVLLTYHDYKHPAPVPQMLS